MALLASIGAKSLSERLSDYDLWWHLKAGQIITTEGLPRHDPFSITAPGRRWVVQEWGSEIAIHGVDSAFGLRGVIIWRAVMLVLVYALVARLIIRSAGNRMGAWSLVLLTAYAGANGWTERPNLFSYLLFVGLLTLASRRDRWIWTFVPLALLWANLHGMVVLGLGFVLLLASLETVKTALRLPGSDPAWMRRLWLVAGAASAVSVINPYGLRLHGHAFGLVRVVSNIISEWASPNFHQIVPMMFLALVALTVAALALTPARPDLTDVGMVIAFVALGLYAIRNLPVAAIVLGTVTARYAPAALVSLTTARTTGSPPRDSVRPAIAAALNAVVVVVVVVTLVALVAANFPRSGSPEATIDEEFPVEMIASLPDENIRLFTTDYWAGLALYLRWPDLRVAFDTRSDFYGNEIIDAYRQTLSGTPGWDDRLAGWCVTHVLINDRVALASVMQGNAGWELIRREPLGKTDETLLFVPRAPASSCGATAPG